MNLISDEAELKKFFNILKPLEKDEAYFISMSARKKYLSLEERHFYNLNRAEMFAHKLMRSNEWRFFLRSLRTFEVAEGGYTDQSCTHNLPSKSLVMYINVNPSSGRKALKEFYSKTQDLLFSTNPDQEKNYAKLDKLLYTCYQRNRGSKHFVDIDMDINELPERLQEELKKELKHRLNEKEVKYWFIKTKSGYHVLLDVQTLKFNYPQMVKDVEALIPSDMREHSEVVVNKNEMIPIPGTFQGDFPVQFE